MISLLDLGRSQLNRLLGVAISYIALGVVIFHWVEKFGWIDSLYYVVVTLATVGYGDLAPKTMAGRAFAVCYIVFGIAIFAISVKAMLASFYIRRGAPRTRRKRK